MQSDLLVRQEMSWELPSALWGTRVSHWMRRESAQKQLGVDRGVWGRVCSCEGGQEQADLRGDSRAPTMRSGKMLGRKDSVLPSPLSRVPFPHGWKGKVVSIKHFTHSLQNFKKQLKWRKIANSGCLYPQKLIISSFLKDNFSKSQIPGSQVFLLIL